MTNWEVLKKAISDIIRINGNQEITGQVLQNALLNVITCVGENATFAGIATPATNPGAPDGPVYYLATTAGTYSNFGGISITKGEAVILMWSNGMWTKNTSGFATQELMTSSITGMESKLDKAITSMESKLNTATENIKTLQDKSDRYSPTAIITMPEEQLQSKYEAGELEEGVLYLGLEEED